MNTAEDLLQLQRFRLNDPFSDSSPYRVGAAASESDLLGPRTSVVNVSEIPAWATISEQRDLLTTDPTESDDEH
jgi:hypothetical protein